MRFWEQLKEISQLRYVSPGLMAVIHGGLEEKDQAFAWLYKVMMGGISRWAGYPDGRDILMVYLKAVPTFDSFRSDPRFADLVRRVSPPE